MTSQPQLAKAYQVVTDRILAALERGVAPWRRPWKGADLPRNLVTGGAYRGVNVFALLMQGYQSPFWATFKQALAAGGHVRKGEKGTPVVFWRWITERKDAQGNTVKLDRPFPTVRFYTVFNLAQLEGVAAPATVEAPRGFDPIAAAEAIAQGMPNRPAIIEGGDQASYAPAADVVRMPKRAAFYAAAGYYTTLFHELTHSTAHASRLGRKVALDEWTGFGSPAYSREELVAEMGASFLMARCDLVDATLEHSAAYLENWLGALRADPSMLIYAGQQAQKAADFILGAAAHEQEEAGGTALALAA